MKSTKRSEGAQKNSKKKTVGHKGGGAGGQRGGGVVSTRGGDHASSGSSTIYDLPVAPQSGVTTRLVPSSRVGFRVWAEQCVDEVGALKQNPRTTPRRDRRRLITDTSR